MCPGEAQRFWPVSTDYFIKIGSKDSFSTVPGFFTRKSYPPTKTGFAVIAQTAVPIKEYDDFYDV